MNHNQVSLEHRHREPVAPPCSDSARTPQLPFVTVIVPCRNEEKHIGQCLDSIVANDYPHDRMEILVLDGMSEDGTREIVKSIAQRNPLVRLVDNHERRISTAMNLGINNARGETVIKMDAHSTYHRDHISTCVRYQEKCDAENVGGIWRMLPGSDTPVAQAIVLAMGHRFGSGNAKIKVGASKPTWSDCAAFGCFKKEIFARVGLFDERLSSNEDMDLNVRIRAAGGRILLVPEIVVDYYADPTLRAFVKHNFADGVWATYVLKFRSRAWSWRHWVPLVFVLTLLGSFALSPFFRAFLWLGLSIVVAHACTNLVASAQIAIREKDLKQLLLLPAVFVIRHLAHGLGSLFGLMLTVFPGIHWNGRRSMKR